MTCQTAGLHRRHSPIEAPTEAAGKQHDQAPGPAVAGPVDLLAGLGAEAPGPRAVRNRAEFPAAAITSCRAHGWIACAGRNVPRARIPAPEGALGPALHNVAGR